MIDKSSWPIADSKMVDAKNKKDKADGIILLCNMFLLLSIPSMVLPYEGLNQNWFG
jgi:hypothetical protein